MKWLWLIFSAVVLTSCATDDQPASPCEDAREHISQCGIDPDSVFPDGCEYEVAEELSQVECASLQNPGKSDLAASLLCRAGLLRHCAVPACESALPADFNDWGDCAELILEDGCAACDYYRCREAKSAGMCGDEGYYLGFGYKYCLRYRQVTEPKMSELGQQWSAGTRVCLMETLENEVPDTDACGDLVTQGYDTHLSCYLGTDFCDLPTVDWLRITNTIDLSDVDLPLMREIVRDCAD